MPTDPFFLETAKVFMAFTSGIATMWVRESIVERNTRRRALRAVWTIVAENSQTATSDFDGLDSLPTLARQDTFPAIKAVPSVGTGLLEELVRIDVANAPAYLRLVSAEQGLFELGKQLDEMIRELLALPQADVATRLKAYDGLVLAAQSSTFRALIARLSVLRVIAGQIDPSDGDAVVTRTERDSRAMGPRLDERRAAYFSK